MFHLDDRQRARYEQMTGLSEQLSADVIPDDRTSRFPREKWEAVAATGLFSLPFTPDRRKSDQTVPLVVAALEGLGHASDDAGLCFSAATQLASSAVALARFGSPQLRQRYEPAIASGELIGAHAISEPEAGSDVGAMSTVAVRDDAEFVLTGRKAFVSNGPVAGLVIVYAKAEVSGESLGMSAFAVERDTPGVLAGEPLDTMGLRTAPLGTLDLVDVRVPEDRLVGQLGGGGWLLSHVMAREILFINASQVGLMQRRLERCVDWARRRHQFGTPIGAFQAVAHAIVDMRIAVETARRWVYDTTARLVAGEDVTAEIAMTKVVVSEADVAGARCAVQVFGGQGYLTATGIERGLRDAIAGTIYSGTSEIQRNKIAAEMRIGDHQRGAW